MVRLTETLNIQRALLGRLREQSNVRLLDNTKVVNIFKDDIPGGAVVVGLWSNFPDGVALRARLLVGSATAWISDSLPSIKDIFFAHVDKRGFPTLNAHSTGAESDAQQSESETSLMGNQNVETCIQQDEYQKPMRLRTVGDDATFLLGIRVLDLSHQWPDSRQVCPFEYLFWLDSNKRDTVIPPATFEPIDESSLSICSAKPTSTRSTRVLVGFALHMEREDSSIGTSSTQSRIMAQPS